MLYNREAVWSRGTGEGHVLRYCAVDSLRGSLGVYSTFSDIAWNLEFRTS
jgi:hypothetical protein